MCFNLTRVCTNIWQFLTLPSKEITFFLTSSLFPQSRTMSKEIAWLLSVVGGACASDHNSKANFQYALFVLLLLFLWFTSVQISLEPAETHWNPTLTQEKGGKWRHFADVIFNLSKSSSFITLMTTMEKSHFCTRCCAGVMISYLLRTCIFTGLTYHHAATLSLPAAFSQFVSNLIDFDDTRLWKADQRAEPLMRVMFAVGGWIPIVLFGQRQKEGLADGMVQLLRGGRGCE